MRCWANSAPCVSDHDLRDKLHSVLCGAMGSPAYTRRFAVQALLPVPTPISPPPPHVFSNASLQRWFGGPKQSFLGALQNLLRLSTRFLPAGPLLVLRRHDRHRGRPAQPHPARRGDAGPRGRWAGRPDRDRCGGDGGSIHRGGVGMRPRADGAAVAGERSCRCSARERAPRCASEAEEGRGSVGRLRFVV